MIAWEKRRPVAKTVESCFWDVIVLQTPAQVQTGGATGDITACNSNE